MATSTTHRRQDPDGMSFLAYGLVFGPAMGMLIALVLFGGETLAAGLLIGAGLGVTAGVLLDAAASTKG